MRQGSNLQRILAGSGNGVMHAMTGRLADQLGPAFVVIADQHAVVNENGQVPTPCVGLSSFPVMAETE
jgi:hypothetical protein